MFEVIIVTIGISYLLEITWKPRLDRTKEGHLLLWINKGPNERTNIQLW